eukprot:TRINITY_DN93936_c0_g1_i1.p1 TRINITY_DN93936_c0_g1~~TRINITY_DN93936_c0_g1_i1.p1  ORF type:complete len:337 (-),score=63.12 TRINITY_DN93936_c0_g1_i1:64-1026(-)
MAVFALAALLGVPAAAWLGWFWFVLRPATRSVAKFGPRSLATFASGLLHGFAEWHLKYTIDTKEAIEQGTFDPNKQYLVVWHPHGAFTISALYLFAYYAAASKIFPGGRLYCAIADLLFNVPGLSELLLMCNARSIDSKTVNKVLQAGNCIAIQPGGIHEQVRTDENKEKVYFSGRLGFVRMAIKHGVPLLPIYAFGENQLFSTSDWMIKINVWFYNTFKVGSVLVHGSLFGMPVSPLIPNPFLMPKRGADLHLRWGKPVDVGLADENPSDEKVREVFDKYVEALKLVFDTHKDKLLPKDVAARGLEVIVREERSKQKAS